VTDPAPSSPLAAQALQRLQKLAEGNGLAPDAIQLYSAEEKTYALEGTIVLSPLFETSGGRYAGAPRGRDRKIMGSGAALKAEVERLRQAFETRHSWISDAIAQLKDQAAGGWGLDDVRIALPNQSTVLAASETCPSCQGSKTMTCQQCQGQGSVVCSHCQGNQQELCHICLGSGDNPSQPGQPCIHCNGLRYAPCRFCNGSGRLTCPSCGGRRGTVCSACNGAGLFTDEVAITCGARTSFRLKSEGLPSGLRRGLDKLGLANLANGHADIESIAPPPDEEEDVLPAAASGLDATPEPKKEKPPKPEVHYLAHLPYADLRMNFAGKKTVVGVFGKKSIFLGVPAFLDKALEGARQTLENAAKGKSNLEDALSARVMRDALKLQLAGVGAVNALRRIYPLGLSPKAAGEILGNIRLALNRLTLRSRSLVAVLSAVAGAGVFGGIFLTSLRSRVTHGWTISAGLAFDACVLLAVLAGCWFLLSSATRFALQKRFPDFTIPLVQKTGKTGYAMLAALVAAFIVILLFSPVRPEWQVLVISKF
jgi:hypothetical protein